MLYVSPYEESADKELSGKGGELFYRKAFFGVRMADEIHICKCLVFVLAGRLIG